MRARHQAQGVLAQHRQADSSHFVDNSVYTYLLPPQQTLEAREPLSH